MCLPDFLSSFGLLQDIPVKFPLFLSGLDYENDHRINKADDEHPEKDLQEDDEDPHCRDQAERFEAVEVLFCSLLLKICLLNEKLDNCRQYNGDGDRVYDQILLFHSIFPRKTTQGNRNRLPAEMISPITSFCQFENNVYLCTSNYNK